MAGLIGEVDAKTLYLVVSVWMRRRHSSVVAGSKAARLRSVPPAGEAGRLLSVCEYLRKLIATLKFADAAQASMIKEVVVPYLDTGIAPRGSKLAPFFGPCV